MAVLLTGTGGLFTRLGAILGILGVTNVMRGSTLPPKIDALASEFDSTDRPLVDNLYTSFASYQRTAGNFGPYLHRLAQSVVIEMVEDDEAQVDSSLGRALSVVIDQMTAATASVSASTVGATVTPAGGNLGVPVFRVGLISPLGVSLQNVFAEPIVVTCDADAQVGGSAPLYGESIRFQGLPVVTDALSFDWPGGSGSQTTVSCITPAAGSLVLNGDFETWTVANVPDSWTIGVGVAGSTVLKSTAVHFDGLASLSLVGNSTENTTLYQLLDDTSGAALLDPRTQIAVNLFLKADVVPAAGVLRVALVDGAGAVINDAAGNANAFTVDLTAITTSFAAVGGFFRTPSILPASVRLELQLTTAVSAGSSIFIDRLCAAEPASLYVQGPRVAVFSSMTAPVVGDSWTLAVTNNHAAAGPGGFQLGFDRMFNMKGLGLLLPTSGSPTVPDGLIA